MNRTSRRLFGFLLFSTALIAISGCESLRRFAAVGFGDLKVRPAPADLPPLSPSGAEDGLYAGAAKAIEARNYDLALGALQSAYAARPRDPRVLNAMAVVYDKLGRFDLSDRYYDLAEAADPGSRVVASNRRYSLLLRQGAVTNQSDGAITLAAGLGLAAAPSIFAGAPSDDAFGNSSHPTKLAAVAPMTVPAPPRMSEDDLYRRSVALIQHRQFGLALGDLNAALAIRRNDPRVLSALGVVYDWLGRFDLSARCYDLAEAADPGSRIVANNRRYSLMLQRHGGADVVNSVVLARDGSSAPTMSLVKARPVLPTKLAQRTLPSGAATRRIGGTNGPGEASDQ